METLILVTAVLRINNLKYICDNIINVFKHETQIKPLWCLCIDQYNYIGDLNLLTNIIKKCQDNNILVAVYYQGETNKANYGGALMNAPLEDLKHTLFKDSNPLMIVLDDDNILSPNLLKFIHEHCINENYIWILNMLSDGGDIRYSRDCDFLAGNNVKYGNDSQIYKIFHTCATIDPSQILFRLNLFFKAGGFTSVRTYDFDFMNVLLYNNEIRNYIRFQMMDCAPSGLPSVNDKFYISCYHNGLNTNEKLSTIIKEISNMNYNDSYIRVHVNDNYCNVQITNQELKDILEKLLNKE
mgnify:FL=1